MSLLVDVPIPSSGGTADDAAVAVERAVAFAGMTWSAPALFAASLAVAALTSTQYLVQPFVWRHWPVDEVLLGWLDVALSHAAMALSIAAALWLGSRLSSASLKGRAAGLGASIVLGAVGGRVLLDRTGLDVPMPSLWDASMHVARWSVLAACFAALWFQWRRALDAQARAQAARLRQVLLDRHADQVRLGALKGQIEPHFLFNTLATVRRLQTIDPPQAVRMLDHFVAYLQAAQPGARETTLGDELDLVRAWLGVVALRMDGRLALRYEIDEALRAHPFPALMLATLAENAMKHGIGARAEGGAILVRVRCDGNELEAAVHDDGLGFRSDSSGRGIGLANIRARLQTGYGRAARLTLKANEPGGVQASIRVPLVAGFSRKESLP